MHLMRLIVYTLISGFATSALLAAWFHEGGICESIREKLTNYAAKHARLVQLINCRKCLTYWVNTLFVVLLILTTTSFGAMTIVEIAVISLAATWITFMVYTDEETQEEE